MKISVVIPVYNRADKLPLCLEAISRQDLDPELFDVQIVDDGSENPEHLHYLETISEKYGPRFSVHFQAHAGPASARNLGVRRATGQVVLFIGDDIIAPASMLRNHLFWHQKNPEIQKALLGKVIWKDADKASLLMLWLDDGWQFDFQSLSDNCQTDFWHFYTAQISIKRDFLLSFGLFHEGFPAAAFEDNELAYRLTSQGLKIYYSASSVAIHDHQTSFLQTCQRSFTVGRSLRLFVSLHPEIPGIMAKCRARPLRKVVKNFRFLLFHSDISLKRKLARIVGFFFFHPIMKTLQKLGQLF